jgi:hypothetical protein
MRSYFFGVKKKERKSVVLLLTKKLATQTLAKSSTGLDLPPEKVFQQPIGQMILLGLEAGPQ